jgi:hypothetical protein
LQPAAAAAAAAVVAALPDPQPVGVRIPRMAATADGGRRPNFIVILTGELDLSSLSQQVAAGNSAAE